MATVIKIEEMFSELKKKIRVKNSKDANLIERYLNRAYMAGVEDGYSDARRDSELENEETL